MEAPLAVAEGDRAFVDEDYDKAVDCYTHALKSSPSSAVYEARAHAHLKLEDYVAAAQDATKALELDPTSSKAYLRKGVACFHLEEYESALSAFEAGLAGAPASAQATYRTWIRKCRAELEEEEQSADGGAGSVAAAAASAEPATAKEAAAPATVAQSGLGLNGAGEAAAQQPPLAPAAPASHQGLYRYQWYQIQDRVVVDIYAKRLQPEQVQSSFEDHELELAIVDAETGEVVWELRRALYGAIIPAACTVSVGTAKVEVTMPKADAAVSWPSLERSTAVAAPSYADTTADPSATRLYPSSKGAKDWSQLDHELAKMEEKGELEDGDPLSSFFKKIFSQGDEDQRRAMMKSFTESNGTVLSTNWTEVGEKKVECTPPDGMVLNKWEQ